jgi:hypothetical protein
VGRAAFKWLPLDVRPSESPLRGIAPARVAVGHCGSSDSDSPGVAFNDANSNNTKPRTQRALVRAHVQAALASIVVVDEANGRWPLALSEQRLLLSVRLGVPR